MLPDTIYLEGIESNKESVFQTIGDKQSGDDLIKSEVKLFDSYTAVFLTILCYHIDIIRIMNSL